MNNLDISDLFVNWKILIGNTFIISNPLASR
ncbi:MAG: hypothetical protein ACJAS1_005813 [Oleiphilaceae bacterium]|jgi:hypothetical protein